jgi:molybdenum cofactor cytidylyltransferase
MLAAGASSRMQGPLKPLLEFDGETFLDRQIGLYAAHCRPVVVVLGFHAGAVRAGLRAAGAAAMVVNPEPERGQLSSLQCGLRALPPECEAVFFLPVDSPGVQPATLQALLSAWSLETEKPAFVVPRFDGRRGHPVLMNARLSAEMLALPDGATARDVVHRYRAATVQVDVADPAIHLDIDDAAAYEVLISGVRP